MPALVGDGIPTEVVDASRLPFGWEQPGFDDSAWGAPSRARRAHRRLARTQPPTDPYGPLYPRPIAQAGRRDLARRQPSVLEYLAGQVDAAIGDPVRRVEAARSTCPVLGTAQAEHCR